MNETNSSYLSTKPRLSRSMDTSQFVQRICHDKRLKGSMKQCNGMQMKLNCHQQTNTQKKYIVHTGWTKKRVI